MNRRWHTIWSSRVFDNPSSMDALIALNGFDTGAMTVHNSEWNLNAQKIAAKMGIQSGDSVYEIGCGCGAFLLALKKCIDITVGGGDYSEPLIEVAKKILPQSTFEVVSATELNTSVQYDHAIAHSMLHYLTLDEASVAIERLILKSKKVIGLFDLPDVNLQLDAENFRKKNLPEGEYEQKYQGLTHTYFAKDWLIALITKIAPTSSIELIPSSLEINPQSKYRFGMIVRK